MGAFIEISVYIFLSFESLLSFMFSKIYYPNLLSVTFFIDILFRFKFSKNSFKSSRQYFSIISVSYSPRRLLLEKIDKLLIYL